MERDFDEEGKLEITSPEGLDAISEFAVPDDLDTLPDQLLTELLTMPGTTVRRHHPDGIGDDLKNDADLEWGRLLRRYAAAVARATARDSSGRPPIDLPDVLRVVGYVLANVGTVGVRLD